MADFTTPFGDQAPDDRRLPKTLERERGFVDGAAIRTLFNGLFHRLEAELGHLMSQAGVVGDDEDNTQVYQAIQSLIESATGSGATENYVQFGQITQTLPIYPEIKTTDNKINISSPASNQCRVPSGIEILHRGVKTYTTQQTDFNLDHSKIYHIRWSPTGGAVAKNLEDTEYNPDNDAETHERFDSTFDDVLLARVSTNSTGVLTITNLKNATRLSLSEGVTATNWENSNTNTARADIVLSYDWARTPEFKSMYRVHLASNTNTDADEYLFVYGGTSQLTQLPFTRYDLKCRVGIDFATAAKYDISAIA